MHRTTRRDLRRRLFESVALMGLFAALLAAGCTAPETTQRGGPGEFCNGSDRECRGELICDRGVCAYSNRRHQICTSVCDRFEQCGAQLSQCPRGGSTELCYQDCLKTLSSWGQSQAISYRDCYLDQLSCSEIRSKTCPQNACYRQLDLPKQRVQTCEKMRGKVRSCYEAVGADPSDVLDPFAQACRKRARTASDRDWARAADCTKPYDNGQRNCGKMFACFNRELPIPDDSELPATRPPGSGSDDAPSPPEADPPEPAPDQPDTGFGDGPDGAGNPR